MGVAGLRWLKDSRRNDGWVFCIALSLLIVLLLVSKRPRMEGDVDEYLAMTVAMADHGSPDIRASDIARTVQLMPSLQASLAPAKDGMAAGLPVPKPGFFRGSDGHYFAIHFFGFSALAAVPFRLLELAGLSPLKGFQIVNLMFLAVLGHSLYRMMGRASRAMAGVALFLLGGGLAYIQWSSPEFMSAAALLAGMAYLASAAPVRGGLLLGVASLQNPPIAASLVLTPVLLRLAEGVWVGRPASASPQAARKLVLGLGAGAALVSLPIVFNLWAFGTPNLIAKIATDPRLASLARLHSFFLDLNQGMVVATPGIILALMVWAWRPLSSRGPVASAGAYGTAALFALSMALPALTTYNWNSGAVGVMRYAFWDSMPLLFLLLLAIRAAKVVPRSLILMLALLQSAAAISMGSYGYLQFSPAAKWVLGHAPGLYNPVPEIFVERATASENPLDLMETYALRTDGVILKALHHVANMGWETDLCGEGFGTSPQSRTADSVGAWGYGTWQYVDGPLKCEPLKGVTRKTAAQFRVGRFEVAGGIRLSEGWSAPERNGGTWDGVWSVGSRSQLVVPLDDSSGVHKLVLFGNYFTGNRRTRVWLDGRDHGWLDLADSGGIEFDANGRKQLVIDLEHEAPASPGTEDKRLLAFFLRLVAVH